MRVSMLTEVTKTDLLDKIDTAEEAIKKLCSVIYQVDLIEHGMDMHLNTKSLEDTIRTEDKEKTHIYITKTINEEAIKEPLAAIQALMGPLKEAVRELDKAIITEMTKEKPLE